MFSPQMKSMASFDKVHLLFEQSGTFKNEFFKLGITAYDYDIVNTEHVDCVIDLFNEIDECYNGKESIFDYIKKNDLIIAFFPCIRFSNLFQLCITCNQSGLNKLADIDKVQYALNKHNELNLYYTTLCKLFYICYKHGLKLILENPIGPLHYLKDYFPIKPTVVIDDRRTMGDYFKKPTQFYFVNCNPSYNFIFEAQDIKPKKLIQHTPKGIARSLISKDFVNRFIREFIL